MKKNILLLSLILTLGILILSASVSMLVARESDSASKDTTPASSVQQATLRPFTPGITTTTPAIDNVTTPPVTDEITPPPTEEVAPPATEEVTPPVTDEVTPPVTDEVTPPVTDEVTPPSTEESVKQEGDALEEILKPSQITLLRPVASGILVKSNTSAIIDYSHTDDGYIMVKFTAATTVRLKVQVTGPTTTYTYNIKPQEWNVFPLSDGNGDYRLKVLKNVVDNRYSTVLSLNYTVKLKDEFAPFLRPNQYVNYENATATMNKAAELVQGKNTLLKKVEAIYSYVINNISYDYEEAATVANDYLPVLDEVLATKKGICFDYAALMTGMLRSQNIACQLVVGYADGAYHAWINVWSPDQGWINGSIFFDGVEWKLMDPTYAAGGSSPTGIQYTSKYIY